jgi:hypothetical protein
MPYHIIFVNLKPGCTEQELISAVEKYEKIMRDNVKGWGGYQIFKHYYFGENRRRFQIWHKIDNFSAVDGEIAFKTNPQIKALKPFMDDLLDMVNHIDECVSEVYPNPEPPSHPM